MWKTRRLLGLLCLVVLSKPALALEPAEPTITWNLSDWPPFHLLPGGQAPATAEQLGEGLMDGFLRLVLGQLPQYRHRFVVLNGPRAEVERKAGLQLCSPTSMRTPERLAQRLFTPALLAGQLQLVLRRERLQQIAQGRSSVSLRELSARTELQGLVMSQRHYGADLAPWLRPAPDGNVQTMVAPRAGNLLTMLSAGRMDYTLEYPMVVGYHQLGQPAELVSLPIEELGESPVGYFSCNRSDWGRVVIKDIDRALRAVAARPEQVLPLYRRWLSEEQFAREAPALRRFLAQRARGGPRIE